MDWENGYGDEGYGHEVAGDGVARAVAGDLGVGSLLGDSWGLVKEHVLETVGGMVAVFGVVGGIQTFLTLAIYLVIGMMMAAGALLIDVIGETPFMILAGVSGSVMYLIIIALIIALQSLAMAAYQMYWLKLVRGQQEKIEFAKVLRAMSLPIVLGALLQGAAVMTGTIALVIGAYVVMLGLSMMPFLIIDHAMKPMQALKSSWSLMTGHKLQFLVVMIVLGVVNMGGMLACGLGMLVTLPITFGAMALFYDRIAIPGNAYLRF